jgi:hypothetical protein
MKSHKFHLNFYRVLKQNQFNSVIGGVTQGIRGAGFAKLSSDIKVKESMEIAEHFDYVCNEV